MAKQEQGINDGYRGAVGTVVGYRWRGKWCVRAKATHTANPRTQRQVAARQLLAAMSQTASGFKQLIRLGLRQRSMAEGMTEGNLFMRLNRRCFQQGEQGLEVDYSSLVVSLGEVWPVVFGEASWDGAGLLSVEFSTDRGREATGLLPPLASDEVRVFAYSKTLGGGLMSVAVSRRRGRVEIEVPAGWVGAEVEVYGFVQNYEGRTSESAYVGHVDLSEALHSHELAIEAIEGEELVVGASLNDMAMVEHNDGIGRADSAQAVGNGDGGAAFHKGVETLLHSEFALGIKGRGSLVENKDRGIAEEGTGDADALALATRKVEATVADGGVVAVGERLDKVVGKSGTRGGTDLVEGVAVGSESDVGGHGVVEEDAVLANKAKLRAEGVDVEVEDIVAINGDKSRDGVVEAGKEVDEGAFASPRRADDGHRGTTRDGEVDMGKNGDIIAKVEAHILELNSRLEGRKDGGIGLFEDHLVGVEHLNDTGGSGGAFLQAVVSLDHRKDGGNGAGKNDYEEDEDRGVDMAAHHPRAADNEDDDEGEGAKHLGKG